MTYKYLLLVPVAALLIHGQEIESAAVKLIAEKLRTGPLNPGDQWMPVVTHTHNWRFSDHETRGSFETTEQQLVDWSRKLGIRAVGVGSPWDPISAASYRRYEGENRDLYYSGKFDQKSVMDVDAVKKVFHQLNDKAEGKTLFYLDNETPKTRMGHVWWFGYNYDYPAWHDYSQDRPIQFFESDPSVELNSLNAKPHRRRSLFEIMALQRKAGALGIFAHPTRWWITQGRFITNIAAMSGLFLVVDGRLDGMAVMSDRPYHVSYQKLWFHFLDTGAKVPGFAETDFALNKVTSRSAQQTFRNYMHISPGAISEQKIRESARKGETFMSNGGFLTVSVDGVSMGSVASTRAGKAHHVRIEAYPVEGQQKFSRVELIGKGGNVLATKRDFPGGVLTYEIPGRDEAHYLVVRAFGETDDPDADPAGVKYMAMSNPVYLHPQGFRIEPAKTDCAITVLKNSMWIEGIIEFQTAGGEVIAKQTIAPGIIRRTVPANARIVLRKPGTDERMFYIAMENVEVEKYLTYLSSGAFRKDYTGVLPSDVPPQAFRIPELREALRTFVYDLK